MTFEAPIQCRKVTDTDLEKLSSKIASLKSQIAETSENAELAKELELAELAVADIEAKDGDFVDVTYRALSAAMLGDRPIDFSDARMLKQATQKLVGHTVYKDHDTRVDNWVGRVASTSWDEETKGLPPGINAVLRLDSVKDPMIVRGVMQGALHSASVTVSFEWRPSHEDLMENGLFFQKLGEEVDGEIVRLVVVKIEKFWEISLVWQGADTYAKQIGEDGKPVQQAHSLSSNFKNNTEGSEMDKLKEILEAYFKQEVTDENVEQLLGKLNASYHEKGIEEATQKLSAEIADLKAKLESSEIKATELAQVVKDTKADADIGRQYLQDVRDETIKLYQQTRTKEECSEVIVKTLEVATLEVLKAWRQEFQLAVEEKFAMQCQSCGSSKVSRQSSKNPKNSEGDEPKAVMSDSDVKKLRDLHS